MRILLVILLSIFIYTNVSAQAVVTELKRLGAKKRVSLDSNGWKRTGMFILNINQSSQSEWNSGGENFMFGINGIINKAAHHRNGKYTFDSYLDIELGVVEASSFKKFRKTTDRFDLTFEAEHSIGKESHFNYGLLGNINTQLFGGHNYTSTTYEKISGLLSPGKILLSFGIDYKHKKTNHYFSAFATPATIRLVTKIEKDFYKLNKFGVDSSNKVYTEIGAYLTLHYNGIISKTTSIISRLDLFSNYKRKPENVDLLLNNVITFNISKIFAGTFILDVLYDHDVKRRTQIQQVSGLGLRLKL